MISKPLHWNWNWSVMIFLLDSFCWCLFVCSFICLFACLFVCWFVCLFACLFAFPFMYCLSKLHVVDAAAFLWRQMLTFVDYTSIRSIMTMMKSNPMENIFQSFRRWVLLAEGWMVKFKWAAKIDTQAIVSRLSFIFQGGEQRRHERIGDKFNNLCHSWAKSCSDIYLRLVQKGAGAFHSAGQSKEG